jgi:hypothetical protein
LADYLSKDTIIEALTSLSAELGFSETPYEVLIAGGAALVLLYGARESTKDVDAVITDRAVLEAARRVAARLALPDDWLNDGAKGFLRGIARGEVVFQTQALTVRALAPPQLLAMKLTAWRDDLDIEDARLLLSKIAGDDKGEIWSQIEPFILPGRELKCHYAFEDLWESKDADSSPHRRTDEL